MNTQTDWLMFAVLISGLITVGVALGNLLK